MSIYVLSGGFVPDSKKSIFSFSNCLVYFCKGETKRSMGICYIHLQLQNRSQNVKNYTDIKLILLLEVQIQNRNRNS